MDNNNVSVKALSDAIWAIQRDYMEKISDAVDSIINQYKGLGAGTLSSAEIDRLVSEINMKTTKLQNDFIQVSNELRKSIGQSQEEIDNANRRMLYALGRQ